MKQTMLLKPTFQNLVHVNQTLISCMVVEQVNIEGGAPESLHFTSEGWGKMGRMKKNSTIKGLVFVFPCHPVS